MDRKTGAGASPGEHVGPPMTVLGVALLAVAVSALLLVVGSTVAHELGYVVGSVVPVLLIGFFRRADLERRRSPRYVASSLVRPAIALVVVAAVVLAAFHVWPLATDLAT